MSTLRTDTLQTPDSLFTINIADIQPSAAVTAFINNLLNNADPLKGAALVGRASRQANTVADLKTFPGRYNDDVVSLTRQATGYNFGGGPLVWDATSTEADNAVTIFQVTGVTTGRWKRLTGSLTMAMFGAKAQTGFSNNAALAAAEVFLRAELAAYRHMPTLEFDRGTYEFSVAPNFGIQGVTILNRGKVKLRNTGTGSAIIMDAGVGIGVNLTAITFGTGKGFIVESGPTATAPTVLIQNISQSEIRIRCWGAGLAQAGFLIKGCVLTEFYIATTPTQSAKENPADYTNGWYLGAKPLAGKTVTESMAGAQTSYCTFYNWLGAACQYGMYIDSTLGNYWTGGDNEYCTLLGAVFTPQAIANRVRGMNYEVNTNGDVECAGVSNSFDCDSVFFKLTGGSGNKLIGGTHDQITIAAGTGNFVGGVNYGRGLSGNLVIVDNGAKSGFGWCYQMQSQRWSLGPSVTGSIAVGVSPFTYTNTTSRPIRVFIFGGASVSVQYQRGGTNFGTLATNIAVEVSPGDSLITTYVTTGPNMNFITA